MSVVREQEPMGAARAAGRPAGPESPAVFVPVPAIDVELGGPDPMPTGHPSSARASSALDPAEGGTAVASPGRPGTDGAPVANVLGQVSVLALFRGVPVARMLLHDVPPGAGVAEVRAMILDRDPVLAALVRQEDGASDQPVADPRTGADAESGGTEVTVVICSLGTEPRLRTTVERVLAGTYPVSEVLVVDNDPGPRSGVRTILSDFADDRLRIVDEPRRGLSVARNTGLVACRTPVIAYTDDDAVPDPGWVKGLVEVFDADPDRLITCVTGLVVPAELTRPEHLWFEQTGGFERGFRRQVWAPPHIQAELAHVGGPGYRGLIYPYTGGEFGAGNNMAFRTEALLALGGFDPALGAGAPARGGEDLDIFRAVLLAGQALAYTPAALVRHHHRDSYAALVAQMYGYGVGMGSSMMKGLLLSPSATLAILRRFPAAMMLLVNPNSAKHQHKVDSDPAGRIPRELDRAELRGYLSSPWHYLRSRVRYRRVDRPGPGAEGGSLETNAFALMFSAAATALLGLVFWAATARGYPAAEVGRAAATISSATTLATLSNLSLGNMYERFLGVTRSRTLPVILRGQLVCGSIAALLGLGFLVVGPREKLFHTPLEAVAFPFFVVVLSVFALQDPILVGLRAAPMVALKNVFHALAKLGLVIALAATVSGAAIVWSWLLPAAVAAIAINVWLFGRGLRGRNLSGPPVLPPLRELLHFFGATYSITLMSSVIPLLLPLIVVYRFGTETNAYFASAWTLAGAATMLIGTVAGPFVAEASSDPELGALPRITRRFVRLLLLVGVGGGAALFVAGPFILGFFGADYAREGTTLIRLMALSLPMVAVGALYGGLARVFRKMRLMVAMQPISIAGILGGAYLLLHPMGLDGIGMAYLIVETLATLVLAVPLVRLYRRAVNLPVATAGSSS